MFLLKKHIIKDLLISVNEIKKLSTGDVTGNIEISRDDEIGELTSSIQIMQSFLRNHSEAAEQMSKGNLDIELKKLSENDILGKAMVGLKENINFLVEGMEKISSSAKSGELNMRMSSQNLSGYFGKIIDDCNSTMDAMSVPIEEGSAVLSKMAEGDFTKRLKGDYKGDFLKIKSSINKVAESMSEALSQVANAVHSTSDSSGQISASIEEIAAGAEEQSSQITEIASSIEMMNQLILKSSEDAVNVSAEAVEASKTTEKGKAVVTDTKISIEKIVDASGKISAIVSSLTAKSRQIGEITQVIEEIAEQTNLLALNAAIEAARAGEHGRGFAVVADEVKKLSERTSKATKEIAGTIKGVQAEAETANDAMLESKALVEKGMENTLKVNALLDEINKGSARLNLLISQIESAIKEQSLSAENISRNIEGITTAVHQSASGTQEIARSAENLNKLTENLEYLIKRFTIGSGQQHLHLNKRNLVEA
jgi:methyl-accepting chemotaxis protein